MIGSASSGPVNDYTAPGKRARDDGARGSAPARLLPSEPMAAPVHGEPEGGRLTAWALRLVERLGWRLASLVSVGFCVGAAVAITLLAMRWSGVALADSLRGVGIAAAVSVLLAGPGLAVTLKLIAHLAENKRRLMVEIERRLQAEEQLRRLAAIDDLTGLHNRRYMVERAREMTALARRHDQPVALITLDIDRFKQINDRHGHATGDEALISLGETLRGLLRVSDVPARYGGDEFVVLMPQTDLAAAAAVAERIRVAVQEGNGRRPVKLSVSLGVAAARGESARLEELMALADMALYAAKKEGRNRVFMVDLADDATRRHRQHRGERYMGEAAGLG